MGLLPNPGLWILGSQMLVLALFENESRLGTQSGWACRFYAYAIGLKEIGVVRVGVVWAAKVRNVSTMGSQLFFVPDPRYLTDSIRQNCDVFLAPLNGSVTPLRARTHFGIW